MSTAKQILASVITVVLTIIILNEIISVKPSAFSDFPVGMIGDALVLAIPTGALFILSRLRGF